MKKPEIKNFLLFCSPLAASAVLLTFIQAPFGFSYLAWIAFVPFIIVCSPSAKFKPLVFVSYVVGLLYWLGNLYWIGFVTLSGWLAFCIYTAILWPALAICIRYCRTKKIPLFLSVPVLIVAAERLQGLFLGGFFWRYLAHSQYAQTSVIQIADIFGAAGVSFLIGMVNGIIAEGIITGWQIYRSREKEDTEATEKINKVKSKVRSLSFQFVIVFAAVLGTLCYGRWRINQSEKFVTDGPMAAALQPNIPQTVKDSPDASQQIFHDLLIDSNECSKAGAELIVWPETMVQAILDERVLRILDPWHSYRVFDRRLRGHSKNSGYVLVGASGGTPEIQDDTIKLAEKYNSAFLYNANGTKSAKQYNKIHLVPFGETVPFKTSWPGLYKILMKFSPYDFDYNLDRGTEYTVFQMSSNDGESEQTYRFGVMICYEGTIPQIARRFASGKDGQKSVDWLVNISNDGWFVRFKEGKVLPSTELPQHMAIYAFRAVENRVAVIRSVNTGISCLIDSLGRVRNGYVEGNLPENALARVGISGRFVDKMPIDTRVTFFTKHGQWLDLCCVIFFLWLLLGRFLSKFTTVAKVKMTRQFYIGKSNESKNGKRKN